MYKDFRRLGSEGGVRSVVGGGMWVSRLGFLSFVFVVCLG